MRSRTAAGLLVALTLTVASVAADEPSEDASGERRSPALAEGLFERGRQLMLEGQFEEACQALADSYRLDPAGGTLLNLAVCYERAGRLASAYAEFQEALRLARRDGREDRATIATERLEALRARLSTLEIRVDAAVQPETLQVLLDGVLVPEAGWNIRVPIDGGSHVVRARAVGAPGFSQDVTVGREGDHVVVNVPQIGGTPPLSSSSLTDSSSSAPTGSCLYGFRWDGSGCLPVDTELRLNETAFAVWMAFAGVLLVGGAVTGAMALSRNGTAAEEASAGDFSESDASHDESIGLAWASTGSFVVGGTFAVLGLTTTWKRVPIAESTAARLRFTGRQVGAELRF